MKNGTFLFLVVSLFLGTITVSSVVPGVMDGFSGVVIWSFLFYCGLIVVAQLFSALSGLRRMIDEAMERRAESKPVKFR